MRIKYKSVKIQGIAPELNTGLNICEFYLQSLGFEVMITSVNDSIHGPGSLHPLGHAADFSLHPTENNKHIHKQLQERLGPEFDLVLEDDHFHLEYQPKQS